jgi:diadenosine tetraphosphate (Ap4A) HIT family hydrolase
VNPCPFCRRVADGDFAGGNQLAVSFPDAFPLNPGYTLIVSRRRVSEYESAFRRGGSSRFSATAA